MVVAVVATLVLLIHDGTVTAAGWTVLICGALAGSAVGLYSARTVQMTAMPQLVSMFNAVGGGAAALVGIYDYIHTEGLPGGVLGTTTVATLLDAIIGAVTLSGSIVAAGKLQGVITGQPVIFRGSRLINIALGVVIIGTAAFMLGTASLPALLVVVLASLAFGVMMVLPIGGADMPVVISLLNAFTGLAVAVGGFELENNVLIVSGMLVGASGTLLTLMMGRAMNRSIANVLFGAFGQVSESAAAVAAGDGGTVRSASAEDVAVMLAYAHKVVFVPGYGLAVAQAQHDVRQLADLLEAKGVEVTYAIHPVAGRMPGHMNVLLAEANVPYPQLKEMDDANPEFSRTDVAVVVGANDVVNPDARNNQGSPIYGMPILNVDNSQAVVVLKRSMNPGFAGIENPLFYNPKTVMLFGDAKQSIVKLIQDVKAL
jgi:NAD(P) transhydrogenase subunit beta